jgi:ATP-binding cassette subfamily F protein uup
VVKVVKDYEEFLEKGSDNHDQLAELMSRLDDLNAWNFESDLKQILGKLNLHQLNEKVGNLSGGQKKRVALAQALIESQLHEGRCLLILDEPCQGLDEEQIHRVKEILDYICTNSQTTLIYVSHYASDIPECVNLYLKLA